MKRDNSIRITSVQAGRRGLGTSAPNRQTHRQRKCHGFYLVESPAIYGEVPHSFLTEVPLECPIAKSIPNYFAAGCVLSRFDGFPHGRDHFMRQGNADFFR